MDLWPLLWLSPAPGQDPTDLRIWQGYEEGKISTTWFPWWLDFAGKDSHLIWKTTFNMISFFNVHLSNARLDLVILNSNADTSDPSGCRQRDLLELGCPVAVRVDGRQTVTVCKQMMSMTSLGDMQSSQLTQLTGCCMLCLSIFHILTGLGYQWTPRLFHLQKINGLDSCALLSWRSSGKGRNDENFGSHW